MSSFVDTTVALRRAFEKTKAKQGTIKIFLTIDGIIKIGRTELCGDLVSHIGCSTIIQSRLFRTPFFSTALGAQPDKLLLPAFGPELTFAVSKALHRTTAKQTYVLGRRAELPYTIHAILTDNGVQFRHPPRYADRRTARYMTHMFGLRCREYGIEHRFTKINHPWTNG